MTSAGYSGTPPAKKLGIAAGLRVAPIDPPADYRALVFPWPDGAELDARPGAGTDLAHLFVREPGRKLVVRREPRAAAHRR